MTSEYESVNPGQSDKYTRPCQFRVVWYDKDNEMQTLDLRDRELALRVAAARNGTVSTR